MSLQFGACDVESEVVNHTASRSMIQQPMVISLISEAIVRASQQGDTTTDQHIQS